ncbi:MAG: ACP S-malonyltransferase [Actinobacteria bacterium]|uniref:[acyl-carrier-protein] S-malonyltransferase n=1 Tax=freshwater metagenome TaxID=449393 RepID=A0A6J6IV81_9ZZZZ|nr:ACP S-malonyltransferase [Actinomycetota bacterium]
MLAFTFPGQGSQRPGMGRPWVGHDSWELVDEASDVAGKDVGALLLDADAEVLKDTRNAQLTTFVSSLMVLDAVERLGIEPSFCAGHSLGEYTALTATGALSFEDGVRLVVERADAMHEAGLASPGTMAAVLGLDDDLVEVACRRADAEVWVANFNAPGQVVIAGSPAGVASAGEHAKELGAKKIMPLQVSGAFHTPFMTAARDRLRNAIALASPRDVEVPVISNVDAIAHSSGEEWSSLLSAQLSSPVRWKHCLLTMQELGVTGFVELGPGGVLTGMAKRTVDDARTISVSTPEELDKLIEWVNASSPTGGAQLEGEHLFAVERLVVSPSAGLFSPESSVTIGSHISVGHVIGVVGETEVRSPFAGVIQNFIAVEGERVTAHQPIAWLRSV